MAQLNAIGLIVSDLARAVRFYQALGVPFAEGAETHFHPAVAQAVVEAARSGALSVAPQESLFKDAPVVGAFENPIAQSLPPLAREA